MTSVLAIARIGGIPAHPLLVHIPVIILPLAALGGLAIALRPAWRERFGMAVLTATGVGALGAVFAAQAGESLEKILGEEPEAHAQAGAMARNLSLLLFVVMAAFVLYPRLVRRRAIVGSAGAAATATPNRTAMIVLAVLTVVVGAVATAKVVDAGHSGADAAWHDAGQEEG